MLAFITIRYPDQRLHCCNLHYKTEMKTRPDWNHNQNYSSVTTAPSKIIEDAQLFPSSPFLLWAQLQISAWLVTDETSPFKKSTQWWYGHRVQCSSENIKMTCNGNLVIFWFKLKPQTLNCTGNWIIKRLAVITTALHLPNSTLPPSTTRPLLYFRFFDFLPSFLSNATESNIN